MNIDLGIPVSDPADPCYIASFPRTKKVLYSYKEEIFPRLVKEAALVRSNFRSVWIQRFDGRFGKT